MQMLARMKQDAAAAPSQRGASPFEPVPPLSGGGPASARRLDSAADDATPRSGGMHARKASQLVRQQLAAVMFRVYMLVKANCSANLLEHTQCLQGTRRLSSNQAVLGAVGF